MSLFDLRLTVSFRTVLFVCSYVILISLEITLPPPLISDIESPLYLFVFSSRYIIFPAILLPVFFTKQEMIERLSYFKGVSVSHALVFVASTGAIFFFSQKEDVPLATAYHLLGVVAEQFIYVVSFSVLAFRHLRLPVGLAIYALFIYSHGQTFDLRVFLTSILLLTTVYRTIIDRNLWWGAIYHFLWNFGIVTIIGGIDIDAPTDAQISSTLIWFAAMLLGAVLLVCQANNMKQTALRMSSRLFFFTPLRQVFSWLFYISRFVFNHHQLSKSGLTPRILQNNILLYRRFRRFKKGFTSKDTENLHKESWPVPSAIIFWHSLNYFEDLLDIASRWAKRDKKDIVFIVPRRSRSAYFESGLEMQFQRLGYQVEFVHSPRDFLRIRRGVPSTHSCWIFGAEFLIRSDEKANMMLRQIAFVDRPIFVHHPWDASSGSIWSLTTFDPDLKFLPRPSVQWLNKNATVPSSNSN